MDTALLRAALRSLLMTGLVGALAMLVVILDGRQDARAVDAVRLPTQSGVDSPGAASPITGQNPQILPRLPAPGSQPPTSPVPAPGRQPQGAGDSSTFPPASGSKPAAHGTPPKAVASATTTSAPAGAGKNPSSSWSPSPSLSTGAADPVTSAPAGSQHGAAVTAVAPVTAAAGTAHPVTSAPAGNQPSGLTAGILLDSTPTPLGPRAVPQQPPVLQQALVLRQAPALQQPPVQQPASQALATTQARTATSAMRTWVRDFLIAVGLLILAAFCFKPRRFQRTRRLPNFYVELTGTGHREFPAPSLSPRTKAHAEEE